MEKINKDNIEDILSLTPMQEGMLFHYLKDTGSDYYFEQLSLEISGEINTEFFEKAWNFVIETNEMLRAVFRWENVDNPVQIILKEHQLQPRYCDLSDKTANDVQNQLDEIKVKDRGHKFDLQEVPFRVTLCKVGEDKHMMIISNHHILYDGWSNAVLLREFYAAYHDIARGKKPLTPRKAKFKEFVKWLHNQEVSQQEIFWKEYLRDFDRKSILPVNSIIGTGESEIKKYDFKFCEDVTVRMKEFVKEKKMTLASILYGAWGILLQKYNSGKNVLFGTTLAVRPVGIDHIGNTVGLFINTLPLGIKDCGKLKVLELLKEVSETLKKRENYQGSSLMDINRYSQMDDKESLFDSNVVIENYPLDKSLQDKNGVIHFDRYSFFYVTPYDLSMAIFIFEENEILVTLTYDKRRFSDKALPNLVAHFEKIIGDILKNCDEKVSEIEILTEYEKKQLLLDFNGNWVPYPQHQLIHTLIREQVERAPDNTAIISGDRQFTYREMDEKARQLSRRLAGLGVKKHTIVGLIMRRSREFIVGILGILKAGAIYLPISPGFPAARKKYILKDSGAEFLLLQESLREENSFAAACPGLKEILVVEAEAIDPGEYSNRPGDSDINPGNPVYVIYTSGTTGNPRGVVIEHRGLVNYIWFAKNSYVKNERLNFPLFTSIAFDLTVTSIFTPLVTGNAVVIYEDETGDHEFLLNKIMKENKVGVLKLTPSHLRLINNREMISSLPSQGGFLKSSIKRFIVGGEELDIQLARDTNKIFNGQIEIYNEYGPTETAVGCMIYKFKPAQDMQKSVPIGVPTANVQIYILDKWKKLVPLEVIGEIYISGEGVAKGYLNQPGLTAKKFFPNPFKPGKRMYKTGDLARHLPDGNIEFVGRVDQQVKIRGFRVELGEVRKKLLDFSKPVERDKNEPGHQGDKTPCLEKSLWCRPCKDAVVIDKEDENRNKYLCAYIVAQEDFTVSELREFLAKELPPYMIPSYFIKIDKIPLTVNGKLDRNSLPYAERLRPGLDVPYAMPTNDLEKTIGSICKEILRINKVGIHDNFFDLGANSLHILQIKSKLKELIDIDIPNAALFTHSTVHKLAGYLNPGGGEKTGLSREKAMDRSRIIITGRNKLSARKRTLNQQMR